MIPRFQAVCIKKSDIMLFALPLLEVYSWTKGYDWVLEQINPSLNFTRTIQLYNPEQTTGSEKQRYYCLYLWVLIISLNNIWNKIVFKNNSFFSVTGRPFFWLISLISKKSSPWLLLLLPVQGNMGRKGVIVSLSSPGKWCLRFQERLYLIKDHLRRP